MIDRGLTDLVVGLDLPVEEAVLLDGRVAVHRPGQQVPRPPARLVRRPEHRRRRPPVHLDVLPARRRGNDCQLCLL